MTSFLRPFSDEDRCFVHTFPPAPRSDRDAPDEGPVLPAEDALACEALALAGTILRRFPLGDLRSAPSLDTSVYTGLGGILFMLLRVHSFLVRRNATLPAPSEPARAEDEEPAADNPLASPEACLRHGLALADVCVSAGERQFRSSHVTFLTGLAGPLALAAVAHHRAGHVADRDDLVRRLTRLGERHVLARGSTEEKRVRRVLESSLPDELLFGCVVPGTSSPAGTLLFAPVPLSPFVPVPPPSLCCGTRRAGFLWACEFVRTQTQGAVSVPASIVDAVVREVILRGRAAGSPDCPLVFSWHRKEYLGAAHGTMGILATLARFYLSPDAVDDVAVRCSHRSVLLRTQARSCSLPLRLPQFAFPCSPLSFLHLVPVVVNGGHAENVGLRSPPALRQRQLPFLPQ